MLRTFVEVPLFTKRWKEIGLGDDELRALQIMLLKDPESGPVMEGTGGIRKVRFSLENRGKSGLLYRFCRIWSDISYNSFWKERSGEFNWWRKECFKKIGKIVKGRSCKK